MNKAIPKEWVFNDHKKYGRPSPVGSLYSPSKLMLNGIPSIQHFDFKDQRSGLSKYYND